MTRKCKLCHGWGVRVFLGLLTASALLSEPVSASDTIEEVNRRWSGADCRLRGDHLVKKGADADGWSKGQWIWLEFNKKKYRVLVSDRTAFPSVKKGNLIAAGTPMVSEGWRLLEPETGEGLALDLRLSESPVRLRFAFYGRYLGTLSVEHLAEIEHRMRLEVLEITAAADERLVDMPAAGPPPDSGWPASSNTSPSSRVAGAPSVAPATETAVELRVVGVTVEPLSAPPGGEIALVVTYSVSGTAAGTGVAVLERRTIAQQSETLTTLEATVSRTAGTHESRQLLRVPTDLAVGVYELLATVEAGGRTGQGSAIFQVTPP